MAEVFTIVCDNVAVTAAQDILCAYAASTKKLQVLAVEIAANGQTTVGNYPISIRNLPSAVTSGSGGSSVTPHNANTQGASPSFTARANDTTRATSGTSFLVHASQLNPINGYYWQPPVPVGDEPKIELSSAVSLVLESVTGTLNISATMWLREV
jgi:hypothetical protein